MSGFDTDILRDMAELMKQESDEPSDIRGLRARAVYWAACEIDRLQADRAASGTPGSPVAKPPNIQEEVVNQVNGEMLEIVKRGESIICELAKLGRCPVILRALAVDMRAAITRAKALPASTGRGLSEEEK